MLREVEVAGLKINAATKPELLNEISTRIKSGSKTFLTTLYSEFLYHSLRDREVHTILSKADLAIVDGVGVLWAEYFLRQRFTVKNYYLKIVQACAQVIYTGASILLRPNRLYEVFPEKIVGADLFWDLAKLAEQENFSVYLVGWYDQKTEKVVEVLKAKYPKLNIVGFANTTPDDAGTVEEIKSLSPDMVLVAFGPIKQERWIAKYLPQLPMKFAVGLGGSFDYAIGKKVAPPKLVRSIGLEWLYRLFTQPHRVVRIYRAFWGLIVSLMRYKVFMSMPLRPNSTAVLVNKNNEVLIVKRNPEEAYLIQTGDVNSGKFKNYWQFPRGGVDGNETIVEAATRELREETGITNAEFMSESNEVISYEWINSRRKLFGNVYKFRGQEQRIVFFKFNGVDEDIKLDNRELVDHKWVQVNSLHSIFHPELHEVVEAVQKTLLR